MVSFSRTLTLLTPTEYTSSSKTPYTAMESPPFTGVSLQLDNPYPPPDLAAAG